MRDRQRTEDSGADSEGEHGIVHAHQMVSAVGEHTFHAGPTEPASSTPEVPGKRLKHSPFRGCQTPELLTYPPFEVSGWTTDRG